MWTLEESIPVLQQIEYLLIPFRAHCALGGSVLHKGQSEKDLDIYVYDHDVSKPYDNKAIVNELEKAGYQFNRFAADTSYRRTVRKIHYQGKIIDLFLL